MRPTTNLEMSSFSSEGPFLTRRKKETFSGQTQQMVREASRVGGSEDRHLESFHWPQPRAEAV